jgi:protein-disulfide isomerase
MSEESGTSNRGVKLGRILTLVTALIVLGGVAGFMVAQRLGRTPPVPAVNTLGGYENQPALGEDNAPVKVILFENFLCEHCQAFEEAAFSQLKRDYIDTGKVQAYYINLAWGEADAVDAGLAGECAYRQDADAFWTYKTALFRAQGAEGESWATVDTLVRVAQESVPELDADDLRACITSKRHQSEVDRDIELGDYVGVEGTPSIVVGNEGFANPTFATLKDAIDQRLAEN